MNYCYYTWLTDFLNSNFSIMLEKLYVYLYQTIKKTIIEMSTFVSTILKYL